MAARGVPGACILRGAGGSDGIYNAAGCRNRHRLDAARRRDCARPWAQPIALGLDRSVYRAACHSLVLRGCRNLRDQEANNDLIRPAIATGRVTDQDAALCRGLTCRF